MSTPTSSSPVSLFIFLFILLYISKAHVSSASDTNYQLSQAKFRHSPRRLNYSWVSMEAPSYGPSCKFINKKFNCIGNDRPNIDYARFFWTANNLPPSRFDATSFLRNIKGKKLLLVGDSIMRNQWSSLLCLLEQHLEGNNGYSNDVYSDYELPGDTTIAFYWLPMLILCDEIHSIAYLDKVNETAINVMKSFDILVFDVAHWFSRTDAYGRYLFKFCIASSGTCLKLSPIEAYREALGTWARVVDRNFNKQKQKLIFRSKAIAHNGIDGRFCNGHFEPSDEFIPKRPAELKVLKEVVAKMEFPVIVQSNTRMSGSRIDAHPATYTYGVPCDCNHWCLPGLPDAWNILLANQISLW